MIPVLWTHGSHLDYCEYRWPKLWGEPNPFFVSLGIFRAHHIIFSLCSKEKHGRQRGNFCFQQSSALHPGTQWINSLGEEMSEFSSTEYSGSPSPRLSPPLPAHMLIHTRVSTHTPDSLTWNALSPHQAPTSLFYGTQSIFLRLLHIPCLGLTPLTKMSSSTQSPSFF